MCWMITTCYACGHRGPPFLDKCPTTGSNPSFPPCFIKGERDHPTYDMCHPCSRVEWNKEVLRKENEHAELHEQLVCGCGGAYTQEERQRAREISRQRGYRRARGNRPGGSGCGLVQKMRKYPSRPREILPVINESPEQLDIRGENTYRRTPTTVCQTSSEDKTPGVWIYRPLIYLQFGDMEPVYLWRSPQCWVSSTESESNSGAESNNPFFSNEDEFFDHVLQMLPEEPIIAELPAIDEISSTPQQHNGSEVHTFENDDEDKKDINDPPILAGSHIILPQRSRSCPL